MVSFSGAQGAFHWEDLNQRAWEWCDKVNSTSSKGWSLISWRASNDKLDTSPGEIFFNEFYRPGLLADLLEGRSPTPSRTISQIDRRQPKVTLQATVAGERTATVRIHVEEAHAGVAHSKSSGARDLRLFRNGLLVKTWRGDLPLNAQGSASVEVTVPVVPGNNRLVAYAFNRDNIKSRDAEASLKNASAPRKGVAHVLDIGVNA